MKVEIDEELWYGVSSDEEAEARAAKSMAGRMGRIVGTKPFPAAAQRLSLITQNPNCLMDEVVSVLESDPALSARLLRLVNSVGFSLRTPCTSVRHAAALVGTEKLNQVASTAAILDMFESGSKRAAELLEHATVVGTLCRYLAFHFGLPPDELFTCGFLHDIGKLMLLETEGEEYLELLGKETLEFDTTHIEERKLYGFDHALLAGHVLAAWNIPHPVPKVVAWHHHVTRAYAESTEISQMVSTLRLADAMSFAIDRPDMQAQIEILARMEAASYMDISEGQLAAMWDEVRALTTRARAVFKGEKIEEVEAAHTSRPSNASMRAVARAKHQELRPESLTSLLPALSERPRQFPCVVCDAPSYANRCSACHGYMCPLHSGGEDEWCQLCQKAYQAAGIPAIRPALSTLFGALLGVLVAAAFFGAASAGAERPMRLMVGPTLILMLLGMLLGVAQRWVRRWWFLRHRPDRASVIPRSVEAVLEAVARQSPKIVEVTIISEPAPATGISEPAPATERLSPSEASAQQEASLPTSLPPNPDVELSDPKIPLPPGMPHMDTPARFPPSTPPPQVRPRHWMSSIPYRTPRPSKFESSDDASARESAVPREDRSRNSASPLHSAFPGESEPAAQRATIDSELAAAARGARSVAPGGEQHRGRPSSRSRSDRGLSSRPSPELEPKSSEQPRAIRSVAPIEPFPEARPLRRSRRAGAPVPVEPFLQSLSPRVATGMRVPGPQPVGALEVRFVGPAPEEMPVPAPANATPADTAVSIAAAESASESGPRVRAADDTGDTAAIAAHASADAGLVAEASVTDAGVAEAATANGAVANDATGSGPTAAPASSVVPIANAASRRSEPPRSGWSSVLDAQGTASGW